VTRRDEGGKPQKVPVASLSIGLIFQRARAQHYALALLAVIALLVVGAIMHPQDTVRSQSPDAIIDGPGEMVEKLDTGIQVSRYSAILGNPLIRRQISPQFVQWVWQAPTFEIQVLVDDLNQVQMYSLTSTDRNFNPEIPFLTDANGQPLRLGIATFSQNTLPFESAEAVYPAKAKYGFSEMISGRATAHERTLILVSGGDGTPAPWSGDGVIDELNRVIGTRGFAMSGTCQADNATKQGVPAQLRGKLRITGFTLTAPGFDPTSVDVNLSPWILDPGWDVPLTCR
jgi:hypothetical protein